MTQAQPPTTVTQAPLLLWMVGAKLQPIAVRRRLRGFESLLFRSLILASACLAASRGLNHPSGTGATAPLGGCLGGGHHRIHSLGKTNTAGVRAHHG